MHGGQKRVDAIMQKYRSLGYEVMYVGIYTNEAYSSKGADDVIIQWGQVEKAMAAHEIFSDKLTDLATGYACADEDDIYRRLVDKVKGFQPAIIEFEQPFLEPFLEKMIKDGYTKGKKIIHSSQNIEYEMKREMMEKDNYPDKHGRDKYVEWIKDIEKAMSCNAHYTIAVTEHDAAILKDLGARNILVAPNGIYRPTINKKSVAEQKAFYKSRNIEKTAVFVASGHPPNWQGFMDMIGDKMGFMPYGTKIIIAGGVSDIIDNHFKDRSFIDELCFKRRTVVTGRVSEDELNAILELADLIILPITTGGGSNLKTAEAIVSQKNLLATQISLRGYDGYETVSGVHLAKNANEFRSKMVNLLKTTPAVKRTPREEKLEEQVLWDSTLKLLERISV
jgi:hypothetical protein